MLRAFLHLKNSATGLGKGTDQSEQRYEPDSTQAIIEQTEVIQPGKEYGKRSLTESRRKTGNNSCSQIQGLGK